MLKPTLSGFTPTRLNELFEPALKFKKIALAISGGPDSLGLMLLVHHWLALQPSVPDIIVYCVNHGLRPEAAIECALVEELARELGFEFNQLIWLGEKPLTGIQAAARAARYGLMDQAMINDGAEVLLTGHHAADQAETIMMRLAHASGVGGLRGMEAFSRVHGVNVFRPLLETDPKLLHRIVLEAQISPADDASNRDQKYERVRWRRVLPMLENLGLSDAVLGKFANRMGRADRALARIALDLFETEVKCDQFGVFSIGEATIKTQPEEIVLRLVSHMIFAASGGRSTGELSQLENLTIALAGPDFSKASLAQTIIVKNKTHLSVMREFGRIDAAVTVLPRGGTIEWDQRFNIENGTEKHLKIVNAHEVSRKELGQIFGLNEALIMAGVRAAPLIIDEHEKVVGLGEISLHSGLKIKLICPE